MFYGSNDGMLHAVKGGQDPTDGDGVEQWAFIAPEHFGKFKRMRDHSPTISTQQPQTVLHRRFAHRLHRWTSATPRTARSSRRDGDKAYLFLSMRRGGRFIYALNVSDPTAPEAALDAEATPTRASAKWGRPGRTFVSARIRASADPVLIFGLGYDAAGNDSVVAGVHDVMGEA